MKSIIILESLQTKYSIRDRSGTSTNKHSCSLIKSIPSNIRNDLKLKYFYQKYTDAFGIPIIGSNKVKIINACKLSFLYFKFHKR